MDLGKPLRWLFLQGEYAYNPDRPSDFVAAVGHEPALVAIYDDQGHVAHVAPADLDGWLARGYRRTPFDLRLAVAELRPQAFALQLAFDRLLDSIDADGDLAPAELATAQLAASELATAVAAILTGAQLAYVVREPDPVAMVDREGTTHRIDPNQIAVYRAQGFREVS